MKKLTILLSALMLSGAAFAHEGKACCKGKKQSCCQKEAKAGKEKKDSKCCSKKKGDETAKK